MDSSAEDQPDSALVELLAKNKGARSSSGVAAKRASGGPKQPKPWDKLSDLEILQQQTALQAYAEQKAVLKREPRVTKFTARNSQDNALISRDESWLELEQQLVTETGHG